MKLIYIIFFSYIYIINIALADLNIINKGKIIKSKPYSTNEATLIISKSNKIYICSVSGNLTQCILSNEKRNFN